MKTNKTLAERRKERCRFSLYRTSTLAAGSENMMRLKRITENKTDNSFITESKSILVEVKEIRKFEDFLIEVIDTDNNAYLVIDDSVLQKEEGKFKNDHIAISYYMRFPSIGKVFDVDTLFLRDNSISGDIDFKKLIINNVSSIKQIGKHNLYKVEGDGELKKHINVYVFCC